MLSQPDDCYCVLLHALVPKGPPREAEGGPEPRLVLFSAYVQHHTISTHLQQIQRSSVGPVQALLGRLFGSSEARQGRGEGQRDRIWMNGPGDVGRAEVAVAHLPSSSSSIKSTAHVQQSLLQQGLQASPSVVQQVSSGAAQDSSANLQCALMSLALPVGTLATQLLSALT